VSMTYRGILERHGPMTVPFLPCGERPSGLSGGPSFSPTLTGYVAPPPSSPWGGAEGARTLGDRSRRPSGRGEVDTTVGHEQVARRPGVECARESGGAGEVYMSLTSGYKMIFSRRNF
jgi:hypothetical protein